MLVEHKNSYLGRGVCYERAASSLFRLVVTAPCEGDICYVCVSASEQS